MDHIGHARVNYGSHKSHVGHSYGSHRSTMSHTWVIGQHGSNGSCRGHEWVMYDSYVDHIGHA